jgi:hypothetical protein
MKIHMSRSLTSTINTTHHRWHPNGQGQHPGIQQQHLHDRGQRLAVSDCTLMVADGT